MKWSGDIFIPDGINLSMFDAASKSWNDRMIAIFRVRLGYEEP